VNHSIYSANRMTHLKIVVVAFGECCGERRNCSPSKL
jgi:hypothetical protein